MQLEKIDIDKIHSDCLAFDEMERSLKTLANRINKIIDVLNEKKVDDDFEEVRKKFNKSEDWEKEFDKEFYRLIPYEIKGLDYLNIKQFIRNLLK